MFYLLSPNLIKNLFGVYLFNYLWKFIMGKNKTRLNLSFIIFVTYAINSSLRPWANGYEDLTIASAQCQAICLKNYPNIKKTLDQCMNACRQMPNMCEIQCSNSEHGCLTGCKYLEEAVKVRPGECPLTSSANHDTVKQPSCLSKCKSDEKCVNTTHKCCQIGCSDICIKPIFNDSIPDLPTKLKPIKIPNSSDIEFEWISGYKKFVTEKMPLTFVLQTRVCPCKRFDIAYVEKWQTLIITGQSGARLNAFDPGKIYQFRLAVVSPKGARGYGDPSDPFPEIADRPSNPPSVKGLAELLTRVYSSGKISVKIGWSKYEEFVLPVSEYIVKWMIDYGYVQSDGQAISALTQFTQSVPPDKVSYVLENLKPNITYRVEVSTKFYWQGDEPIISEPSSLFLSTPSLGNKRFDDVFYHDFQNCNNKSIIKNEHMSLMMSIPEYANGETVIHIKVINKRDSSTIYHASWTPQICIDSMDNLISKENRKTQFLETTKNAFKINNILFNCRYQIKIKIFQSNIPNDKRPINPPSIEGEFCVPSCSKVLGGDSSDSLKCLDFVNKAPSQPQNLSSKLINSSSKTYELTWNHPISISLPNEEIYQSRYRIAWGPRLYEPIKHEMYSTYTGLLPIIDASKSNVKVINKDTNSLILTNLQPQTIYMVKAQLLFTLSDGLELESDISIHYFSTGLDTSSSFDIPNNALSQSECHGVILCSGFALTIFIIIKM